MGNRDKPLVWLHGIVKTPPFSANARLEAGYLLRLLQQGESLTMPQSRPMQTIGSGCHELRIRDESNNWRIVYCIDSDAVVILEVFAKKTGKTPKTVIDVCRTRLKMYEDASKKS